MIDFESANQVFDVYGVSPSREGAVGYHLLGRFLVEDGKLRILEDHRGLLKQGLHNGPVSRNLSGLNSLSRSSYIRIVAESEVTPGQDVAPEGNPNSVGPQPESPPAMVQAPDLTPGADSLVPGPADPTFTMQAPPPVFDYFREGMVGPQKLEVVGQDVYMNGHKLTQPQVDHILYTINSGLAKLKYRKAI